MSHKLRPSLGKAPIVASRELLILLATSFDVSKFGLLIFLDSNVFCRKNNTDGNCSSPTASVLLQQTEKPSVLLSRTTISYTPKTVFPWASMHASASLLKLGLFSSRDEVESHSASIPNSRESIDEPK